MGQTKGILVLVIISFLLSSAQCVPFFPEQETGGTTNGGDFYFLDYTGAREWNNEEIRVPPHHISRGAPHRSPNEFEDANL
nr:hypothetical protein Iba_chr14aCG23420 [Ipomoea batatas]